MPARFNAVLNDLRQVIHGRPSYVNTASSGLGLRSGCSSSGSRLGRACSGKIESDCAWRKTSISFCELEQPKAGTEALGLEDCPRAFRANEDFRRTAVRRGGLGAQQVHDQSAVMPNCPPICLSDLPASLAARSFSRTMTFGRPSVRPSRF